MKKTMRLVFALVVMLFWLLLLLSQHIACFDVFESGFWYLYVLAVVFALLQFGLIHVLKKDSHSKWWLISCGVIYAVVSLLKLVQLLFVSMYEPHLDGLAITCFALDVFGAAFTAYKLRKAEV